MTVLVSLADSLEPLRAYFNDHRSALRFIALMSPTWAECLQGARAVQTSIVQAFPDADIRIAVVWIDMLSTDDQRAAEQSSAIFRDQRVKQFHDPAQRLGKLIAQRLGRPDAVAWDIYLFFEKGGQWDAELPKPIAWAHQLSRYWPEQAQFGQALPVYLRQFMEHRAGGVV